MRSTASTAALSALGLFASLSLSACAPAPTAIKATGRVVADSLTVQAPTLDVPAINLNAGFVTTGASAPATSKVPLLLSMASGQKVIAVEVKLGDTVRAGDVLLRFDDDALAEQVHSARADLAVAKAQVGVLDSAIDTTHDKEQELRDKRSEIEDGIAKATKARTELTEKLAEAKKARSTLTRKLAELNRIAKKLPSLAEVNARLAQAKSNRAVVAERLEQAQRALAALPPDAPPEQRAALEAAVAAAEAALKQIDAGIAQLTGLRKTILDVHAGQQQLTAALKLVNAGIPQLTRAIATIDANLAKARDGLRQIDKGIDRIRAARADLKRTRTLARIAARNTTAVDGARNELAQAVVKAPADGVVAGIAKVGDVVAPGATVAELGRPAHAVRVWLAPDEVAQVCVGDSATVALDSLGALAAGTISRVMPVADYPPSYTTTGQVHLTRAVQVDVSFPTAMPPGVPADVQISPCRNSEVHA